MKNDTILKTLTVALLLCLVCSVIVSSAAVGLRERQLENKRLYEKKNLLLVTGLLEDPHASKASILQAYASVETRVIDFKTGEYTEHDPEAYDQEKASKNPAEYHSIDPRKDIAGIKTRAGHGKVYLIKDNGTLSKIVIPIKGKGLWSTLYGLLALESDARTVYGISFFQHGETPGLGGEIDNPDWKSLWKGKQIYNDLGKPVLRVVKGRATEPMIQHKIDGLTGATITSVGVENLINYWHGDDQYGKFLKRLRLRRQNNEY